MAIRNVEAEMRHLWRWARDECVMRDLPAEMTFLDEGEGDDEEEGMRLHKRVGVIDYTFTVDVVVGRRRREIAKLFAKFPEGHAVWSAEIPAAVSEAALEAGRVEIT